MILATVLTVILAGTAVFLPRAPIRPDRPAPSANLQFITVQPNVELEVLDFGGTGRPVILLAGLGDTAHRFERFAVRLNTRYHVWGITRRGFGFSSAPASGYTAQRLGADVVAVIDALHLAQPVHVGHSMAGEELSSVVTYHREKIAGLVYLDAGYAYALWDQVHGNLGLRLAALAGYIEPMIPAALENTKVAIFAGQERFTTLHAPVLAIFADPHDLSAIYRDPVRRAAEEAQDFERTERQVRAFHRQVPTARVVRLAHASHVIFRSNEAEVLREMDVFIQSLH